MGVRDGWWGEGRICLSSRNGGYICIETRAEGVTGECLAWVGRAAQHGGPMTLAGDGSAGVVLNALPLFPYRNLCPNMVLRSYE